MSLESKVLDWFGSKNIGESSKYMALTLTGHSFDTKWIGPVYPHDPDDFNRCYLLLKMVPELRELLPEMAEVNGHWKALVARWNEVEQSLISEIGENGEKSRRAPLTYNLMRSIYEPIEKNETSGNSTSSVASQLAGMLLEENARAGKTIEIPSLGIKLTKENLRKQGD